MIDNDKLRSNILARKANSDATDLLLRAIIDLNDRLTQLEQLVSQIEENANTDRNEQEAYQKTMDCIKVITARVSEKQRERLRKRWLDLWGVVEPYK